MKKTFFIFAIIIYFSTSFAFTQITIERQVIGSSGNSNNGTIKASSTIGEAIISTFFQTNIIFTQGFQQPVVKVVTEISENTTITNFSFYPNPIKDILNLEFQAGKKEEIKVKIINLLGQVVLGKDFKTQIGNNKLTLEINDIPKGIYLLRITCDNSFSKIIVKE